MTKQQLMDAGFTEEQANKILEMHKADVSGQYIPKHRFDEVNNELKTVKTQLVERDTQIAGLKKFEGDNAALKEKINQLETDNKNASAEYEKKFAAERKENAVKMFLLGLQDSKPHDNNLIISLLDMEKVVITEKGEVVGLSEQVQALQKEKSFLFTPVDSNNGNQNQPPQGQNGNGNLFNGWKPFGNTPNGNNQQDKKPSPDQEFIDFGKSLAGEKLGALGIDTNTGTDQTK